MTAFMKRPGRLTIVETYRVAVLLGVSFGAMFLAMVPLVLDRFALGEPELWACASGVMVVSSTVSLTVFLLSTRQVRLQAPEIFNPWLFAAIAVGHIANTLLQIFNAWRPAPATASGIYVVGLMWFVTHAAIQFSRILFVQPADR
jgi:hypothetical protein